MQTSDFDFHLPEELIAQHPPADRTDARMMVLDRETGTILHKRITDLPEFLNAGDCLVVNDTRVTPVRLFGRKKETGGAVEILLLGQTENVLRWRALCGSSRSPGEGAVLELCAGRLEATVLRVCGDGVIEIGFSEVPDLYAVLDEAGEIPLPPYIKRNRTRSQPQADDPFADEDRARYQTVYAKNRGSSAAPTAGLHLTDGLLEELGGRGVLRTEVTLHVGLGTFRPVGSDKVDEHRMDPEAYSMGDAAAGMMTGARANGGRIIAVGTTTTKTLETIFRKRGRIAADSGDSKLYIYPPFEFKGTDGLLTNFHLPKSTLLMLISAFAGRDAVLRAYSAAVAEKYRFFSYGDCMLII